MKNKKTLWILLGAFDVAITGFLFVIHIIMLSNIVGKDPAEVQELAKGEGLIAALVANTNLYLGAFVIPLFVILAANIIGLVIYVRKNLKKERPSINELSEEDREAIKAELLKDLQAQQAKAEEPKAE